MASRRNMQSTPAELSLVHLKNCLVNLPPSLVSLLVNVNAPAQNVVVELSYRDASNATPSGSVQLQSVFLGWTGMPSKRRVAPLVGRDGVNNTRGSSREHEVQVVEVDATFATTLGLSDGQKVTATVHIDPPVAHTINIEPLTPEDWEIIELHATFLELNLQSQIRALPNPSYTTTDGTRVTPHPLTLHLSPTSNANIKIVSLDPAPSSEVSFVKLSPNAEVIVAPKTRTKIGQNAGDHRSVTSTSRSKRSGASTIRKRNAREEQRAVLFLRGIDRSSCEDWFDDSADIHDLSVWIDRDRLFTNTFRGVDFVLVDVIRPAGFQQPQAEDVSAQIPAVGASKIVAQLRPWDDPPNDQAVALSSPLCAALGCTGMVGGIVKIQPARQPFSRGALRSIKVLPFALDSTAGDGIKFGGESKAEKEESAKRFRRIYAGTKQAKGLLQGPLTDGMVVAPYELLEAPNGWEGGILKFEYSTDPGSQGSQKEAVLWTLNTDANISIEFQGPVPRPNWLFNTELFELQPSDDSMLVGINPILDDLRGQLSHLSSALLSGSMGSGKTSVARYLAKRIRQDLLLHTTYLPCRKLINDETRVLTIKETLNRAFMNASWGARLGGKALVVLDDLDRLCPVETELQVGNDNGRSRQISEIVCSVVRQYCTRESGVVLLATAQGKDSLNNVIVSGHVVREIVELKAPEKEVRRKIMESLTRRGAVAGDKKQDEQDSESSRPATADGSISGSEDGAWMDGVSQDAGKTSKSQNGGFVVEDELDFLDIAGLTDGYMPGDLQVLVSRARNEAIMRAISTSAADSDASSVRLGRVDFDHALKGFTPASLRNVSLQSSSTTFASIGGLKETRQILLETLQYPTKYAPIFAQCPLRLRSGLLLYGYPGCGKTLLASAVAGECGLNFISVKGPEILNKYIGASEKSVRDLFDRAQAARPCVLFFDEFDSIAPKRGHDSTGVTDRVVNQLLTQMDGAEGLSGVYVLAATSRPDLIDPALLRPGRLDKSLLCDLPSAEDRLDILKALLQKVRLSDDLAASDGDGGLAQVAQRTEGFSGADLQALVSNAQLEAIHDVLDLQGPKPSTRRVNGHSGEKSDSAPTFVQFRYGDEGSGLARSAPQSTTGALMENAAIVAKLEQIKLARKKAKQAQRGAGSVDADQKQQHVENPEVVIDWSHLTKALQDARSSISPDEKARLQRIYREFVVGRSGQLKDGQGSMEIGGRSSLM